MFSRKLMDGLRCIDDFTTKCLDEDHRAYFNTLYTGTTQVIMDLCQTGDYQTGAVIIVILIQSSQFTRA